METEHRTRVCGGSSVVGGLVVMTIGLIFLLENFNILSTNAFSRWWPILLIIVGVSKLIYRKPVPQRPNELESNNS